MHMKMTEFSTVEILNPEDPPESLQDMMSSSCHSMLSYGQLAPFQLGFTEELREMEGTQGTPALLWLQQEKRVGDEE